MNVRIELEHDWTWLGHVAVKGIGFDSTGARLNETQLAKRFMNGEVKSILQKLNGFFAVVINRGDMIIAAVDRVRSIPLFYAFKGSEFLLSDNARWIREQLSNVDIDKHSAAEFLMTGYVTGPFTLIHGLRQLQAGEYLVLNIRTGKLELNMYYHLFYPFKDEYRVSERELMEVLDAITMKSIQRLVDVANGRTIVIPLSGGLDSRLIAMQLRRLGYQKIIAFSYGVPGNSESVVSQKVAAQLKIPWEFVSYDHGLWKSWYSSREYAEYVKRADGLCSVAHVQDWPAVWMLCQKRRVPEDAIFVPGHSADFVAGSHIPDELLYIKRVKDEHVCRAIWKHHYSLSNVKRVATLVDLSHGEIIQSIMARIRSLIMHFPVRSVNEAVCAYENWDWRERQAKFIVNSVRVYEYWGYQWWLPWWDVEFVEFWRTVPLTFRIRKLLYDKYVGRVQRNAHVEVDSYRVSEMRQKIKEILYRANLYNIASRIRSLARRLTLHREYQEHFLAWYGITTVERCKHLFGSHGNINTILAIDQLDMLQR